MARKAVEEGRAAASAEEKARADQEAAAAATSKAKADEEAAAALAAAAHADAARAAAAAAADKAKSDEEAAAAAAASASSQEERDRANEMIAKAKVSIPWVSVGKLGTRVRVSDIAICHLRLLSSGLPTVQLRHMRQRGRLVQSPPLSL